MTDHLLLAILGALLFQVAQRADDSAPGKNAIELIGFSLTLTGLLAWALETLRIFA